MNETERHAAWFRIDALQTGPVDGTASYLTSAWSTQSVVSRFICGVARGPLDPRAAHECST